MIRNASFYTEAEFHLLEVLKFLKINDLNVRVDKKNTLKLLATFNSLVLLNTPFTRKAETGSLGWLRSSNIITTIKTVTFLDIFQF